MISLKTLYQLITDTPDINFNFFREIMEYDLFRPLIEIKDIEADPPHREFYRYSKENIIKLIKFVAHCYSKESPYMKLSDTVYTTKIKICNDLGIDSELMDRIVNYKIPELDIVIQKYITRELDEHVREFMIARDIYDRNLTSASSAVDPSDGSIDVKKQTMYFENAERFKEKLHQLRQAFQNKNQMFTLQVNDFSQNVKSLRAEDLLPR